MSLRVLLVVDAQNCFCPNGSLAVTDGDKIMQVANELMQFGRFDAKVASKDWHPPGHSSFKIWPEHAVQQTYGAEFHRALRSDLLDHVVYKGCEMEVDSYSAFYDNDGVRETGLREWLTKLAESRGERFEDIHLTVLGLATDYCVKFTAIDAAKKLNLKVDLVLDGCRAVDQSPGSELKNLREMVDAGVTIRDSRSILRELGMKRDRAVEHQLAA